VAEPPTRQRAPGVISVRDAREHNLAGVDVDIPRGSLTVVTGVSGSGKSSLAFDTIFAEGRRRYLETFSSFARQFLGKLSRPLVGSIEGLSPAVSVSQSTVVRSPRSTVGTMTEIYDLLRLLWARLGSVEPGAPPITLQRQLFSFNSPHGACPVCKGLGLEDRLDPELLVAHADRTVRGGALRITTPTGYVIYSQVTIDVLDQVCRAHGFSVDIAWKDLTPAQRDIILNGSDIIRIPYGKHPLESRMKWTGITAKPREEGVYKGILPVMEQILRQKRNDNILRFVRSMPCRACGGTRLRPEALSVTFGGHTIAQAAATPVRDLPALFEDASVGARAAHPAFKTIRSQILERVAVLERLGLGYLTLDRDSTTLSGGEAQRLRLARQASIGLSGLLYVLDEPSIGLHPQDTGRLLDVLFSIRERGNTLLVVEHDEDTIREADWIVDVGPGPGPAGGRVLFSGPYADFVSDQPAGVEEPALGESRTRAFLIGRERIDIPSPRRAGTGTMVVSGLSAHNLKDVQATFLLGAFNVVSGVSGAGKSTLLDETQRLVSAAIPVSPTRKSGSSRTAPETRAEQAPPSAGSGPQIRLSSDIHKVISIDQAPIGRTPRSNPATYTGIFDTIRDVFAAEPAAIARGFSKGRFSFNVAGGRCEACEGAGVLQIGMQFMGPVTVVCDVCGGQRFNEETLSVRWRGQSVHDVLEMSIDRACECFADVDRVSRVLAVLRDLGLGYLPLGHPAPMLSGGEAQRVKLAAELARPAGPHTVYVLDEPTTGLHAADVVRLLAAVNTLVLRGHTVIAIEHHLDVLASADHIVDMGPGSGDAGGRIVVAGTPEVVAACPASATGAALRVFHDPGLARGSREPRARAGLPTSIRATSVATHNLRHVDVDIPHNQLTVITGVSGSGKSSLAFDTIFTEGQRRFGESLSAYSRRFVTLGEEAEFDELTGLTPTVAISQHMPSRNPRSSVGTLTGILDLYRLIYSRAGVRHCPDCGIVLDGHRCPSCAFTGVAVLTSSMFSANAEAGACTACHGLGHALVCDPTKLVCFPDRPLAGGAMDGHKAGRFYGDPHGQHMATLSAAAAAAGIDVSAPWTSLTERARELALHGAGEREFDVEWRYERGARRGVHRFRSRWPGLLKLVETEFGRKHGDRRGGELEPLMSPMPCAACGGARLRPEARAVTFGGVAIHELLAWTVGANLTFFDGIDSGNIPVETRSHQVSAELRTEITKRLARLGDAGLAYLSLDRMAASLSGGEAQRVRLASLLQSGLTGLTFVLDEPTVGLHGRDTERLLGLLRGLRDAGNTLIVVEHDLDIIEAADHVIEIGPGAGQQGGQVVACGTPETIASAEGTATGPYLRGLTNIPTHQPRVLRPGLVVLGANIHNLTGVDVNVPSGGLIAVTGVSGSGKSSLVFDVVVPSLEAWIGVPSRSAFVPVHAAGFEVCEPVGACVNVGESAVGVSSWVNPATHMGIFDVMRHTFASTPEAMARGLRKVHFSISAKGGRCETCEGLGEVKVSMDFLPDLWVPCEDCGGRRYGPDVLACTVSGRTIADVLDMTADDAREEPVFAAIPGKTRSAVRHGLDALRRVGLGYIRLGQQARTLSGGERQRLVLAAALAGSVEAPAFYFMDEPTTGLHAQDVDRLLDVFDALIEQGHTVVVVEHHLDVIARADWVIDLGPEGGTGGGQVVATGPPDVIAANGASWTGRVLAARHRSRP
jgi:excinuclease ABC subunit A